MAQVQSWKTSAESGGGGGGTTYAWRTDTFEQATGWLPNALTFTLSFVPADGDGVIANFQNGNLLKGIDYSISGATVTIIFPYDIDPDLTGVIFQFQYPYIP